MKPRTRRFALWALFLALPLIGMSAVHILFSLAAHSEIERRGIPAKYHNAMKHAYAAGEFYSLARIALEPEQAQTFVVELGKINEWIERYLKHDTDVSTEVYKDLRNNVVGIRAAEWLYAQEGWISPGTLLRLIGRLANDGDLAAWAEDRRIPALPKGYDISAAIARMDADLDALSKALDAGLVAKNAALRADLGL